MFRQTAEQIALSPISQSFQNALWVVPASQSVHIVCLSVLFASAAMINLRLLNIGNRNRSVSQLVGTLIPWMWRALLLLLITGTIQTIAEPVRQFVTPIFWGKMGLIIVCAGLTVWFARSVRADPARWDSPATRPVSGRIFAVVSTVIWLTVIAFGRFIGYVWQNYA